MKNRVFFLTVLLLLLTSCNKNKSIQKDLCNSTDPINELSWLNGVVYENTLNLYSGAHIYSYVYESSKVFLITNPASSIFTDLKNVYDCRGNTIIFGGDSDTIWANFEQNRTIEIYLWKKM